MIMNLGDGKLRKKMLMKIFFYKKENKHVLEVVWKFDIV